MTPAAAAHHGQRRAVGVMVIGDELLTGKRQDRHLAHVIGRLAPRGLRVAWCRYVGDDLQELTEHLRQSRDDTLPVFCFGGIGATPDDCTRQAAARAFGRPLLRHAEAAASIEARFGADASPYRIRMAELPEACLLIPNPHNGIPGFTLHEHHFLPGFPELAWPMLDWLLETRFPASGAWLHERSVRVAGIPESRLVPLLEQLSRRHAAARLFSLPRLGEINTVEIGFRGPEAAVTVAFAALLAEITARGIAIQSTA